MLIDLVDLSPDKSSLDLRNCRSVDFTLLTAIDVSKHFPGQRSLPHPLMHANLLVLARFGTGSFNSRKQVMDL